jgi:thioredoxin reductase (NADPH)
MADQDWSSAAFPKLNDAQLKSLQGCSLTRVRQFRAGERLFEGGQRGCSFFVVKSGEVEIVDESGDNPKTLAVLGPGEFTGEISQLIGAPAPVTGRARTDCEAYEVSEEALRQLLNHHPEVGDVILSAFIARRHFLQESEDFTGLLVIGSRDSKETFKIREFLAKNGVPFRWIDLDTDPQVKKLLDQFQVTEADMPIVVWGRKLLLRNPSHRELADRLGLRQKLDSSTYDLVIVGGGPAGLAAAVYGASEGLRTVVLERTAPGGQAGRSMRIENYLGFPTGITGAELAERAMVQASKFGAKLSITAPVVGLAFERRRCVLQLDGGEQVAAKCLLIATGADYRLLGIPGCDEFEGRGVYYAATPTEAQMCWGSDVVVVGGGNSAGQATVYLASQVRKVHLVVRGNTLYKDMSSYLAERIEQTPNVEVLLNSEVVQMSGDDYLSEVEIVNRKTNEKRTIKAAALFSFIGAVPRTEWLPAEIAKDDKGFVLTGIAVARSPQWEGQRDPYLLETSRRGVFAAGDVRAGSVKRVASAVGEGAMAVQFVHAYLAECDDEEDQPYSATVGSGTQGAAPS